MPININIDAKYFSAIYLTNESWQIVQTRLWWLTVTYTICNAPHVKYGLYFFFAFIFMFYRIQGRIQFYRFTSRINQLSQIQSSSWRLPCWGLCTVCQNLIFLFEWKAIALENKGDVVWSWKTKRPLFNILENREAIS